MARQAEVVSDEAICRYCAAPLRITFVDLGMSPLSNAFLLPSQLDRSELYYPLHAYLCTSCFLVQIEEFEKPERIFSDYAYFSSYSDTWRKHVKTYAADVIERFELTTSSKVVEIGSNDGCLLRFFAERRIPVLGIEPASNVARVANDSGIPTQVGFFGTKKATELRERMRADLLVGNNVLAHVPDLNDVVEGLTILLATEGVVTMEFPHLLRLLAESQFDTIYHEHFSYFSFLTVVDIFAQHGLQIFDVEEQPTHGGSLRIYAQHSDHTDRPVSRRVHDLARQEDTAGLRTVERYLSFAEKVARVKRQLLKLLIEIKDAQRSIVGYGAPAKGNTLLNYCGIGRDFLDYTADRNVYKQGRFLPGTHIPVVNPDRIRETRPDYVLILAWNLREEIMRQLSYIRDWNGRFVVATPEVRVYD